MRQQQPGVTMAFCLLILAAAGVWQVTARILIAQTIEVPQIAGAYAVSGTSHAGDYHGHAKIQQHNRTVFVQWDVAGQETAGFGLITGLSMAVGYAVGDVGSAAVYTIDPSHPSELHGEWTDASAVVYTETLTREAPGVQARLSGN